MVIHVGKYTVPYIDPMGFIGWSIGILLDPYNGLLYVPPIYI